VSQSAIILGALLAGFVLYLAAKNRLGTYVAVLWGPTPDVPQPAAAAVTSAANNAASNIQSSGMGTVDETADAASLAAFAF
jgi:hypothetical protein